MGSEMFTLTYKLNNIFFDLVESIKMYHCSSVLQLEFTFNYDQEISWVY